MQDIKCANVVEKRSNKPLRPSPSESATDFQAGTRRRGNDGRTFEVVETKAGVRRWAPVGRRITTLDNGGAPFAVDLVPAAEQGGRGGGVAHVSVLSQSDGQQQDKDAYVFWRSFEYEQAFIGSCGDAKGFRVRGEFAVLLREPSPKNAARRTSTC